MTADLQGAQRGAMAAVRQVGNIAMARVEPFQQPLQNRADQLSRRAWCEAQAQVLNAAMAQYWRLSWETAGGVLVGHDVTTWRIAVAAPWGWRSYQKYGLRRGQAKALGTFVRAWWQQPLPGGGWPTLTFDDGAGRWCVNRRDYATYQSGAAVMLGAITSADIARLMG